LRLFVTGYKGLLGSKIIKYSEAYPKERIDITKKEIFIAIKKVKPEFVIHCAAFTDVDGCEIQKEKAWEVNVTGTENVAKACQKIGAKMIYVSTDFVFDGKKGMYKETDKTNPINYYGKTKLEGEKRVKEICKNYVIARTSVLYGWHERLNFVTWVIEQLKNKNKIRIVTDQYTSPTLADNLAKLY
jgi:dTDP-4-dehydrorhamnose reductase